MAHNWDTQVHVNAVSYARESQGTSLSFFLSFNKIQHINLTVSYVGRWTFTHSMELTDYWNKTPEYL